MQIVPLFAQVAQRLKKRLLEAIELVDWRMLCCIKEHLKLKQA